MAKPRNIRMTECPYCGNEYDLTKACNCTCPHEKRTDVAMCDACIEEQLKNIKPLPRTDYLPAGTRSVTGPALTLQEKRDLNTVLREAQ